LTQIYKYTGTSEIYPPTRKIAAQKRPNFGAIWKNFDGRSQIAPKCNKILSTEKLRCKLHIFIYINTYFLPTILLNKDYQTAIDVASAHFI